MVIRWLQTIRDSNWDRSYLKSFCKKMLSFLILGKLEIWSPDWSRILQRSRMRSAASLGSWSKLVFLILELSFFSFILVGSCACLFWRWWSRLWYLLRFMEGLWERFKRKFLMLNLNILKSQNKFFRMSELWRPLLMKILKLLNFTIKMNICMKDQNMQLIFMDFGNFIHNA